MEKLLNILRWSLWALFATACAAVVALVLYIESESFQRWFEARALATINEEIQGTVSWDRLEGSLWTGWRAHNLKLRYAERDVFKAGLAEIDYALLPLLWKRIEISRLAATRPILELSKLPNGEWNLEEALSSRQPSSGPFAWTITIRGINIAGGELTLLPVKDQPDLYRLQQLMVTGSLTLAEGLNVKLDQIASWVDTPQQRQIYASGGLTYRQDDNRQSLEFAKFWLQHGRSKIMLAGAIKDLVNLDSDLSLTINHLAAADLSRHVPNWPAGVDLSGEASVNGPGKALDGRFNVQLSSRGQIYGNARADVVDTSKPFSAAVHVRTLALGPILRNLPITGALNADLNVAGAGGSLKAIRAGIGAQVSGLVVQQHEIGAVTARGTVVGQAADLSGTISGAIAKGSWQTQVRFAGKPEYRVNAALSDLDPLKLTAFKELPAAGLNLKAQLKGSGFEPATMTGDIGIDLQESRWGAVKINGGKITGRFGAGRLQNARVILQAGGATLSGEGNLGISAAQTGSAQYRLQVADLAPWLELFGQRGSGRLRLNGRADGNIVALRTAGTVDLFDIKLPEGSAAGVQVNFALERNPAAVWPRGSVQFTVNEPRAGVDLALIKGAVTLPASSERSLTLSGLVRDTSGHSHRLVADIENVAEEWSARARELMIALPDGSWSLSAPARLSYRQNDFVIDRIGLRNGRAEISAAGQFSLQNKQALTIQLKGIELATLRQWWPDIADIKGSLAAQAQMSGTAAQPEIEASASVVDGNIAGQSYRSANARVEYRRQQLSLEAVLAQDERHELSVRGTAPLALAWYPVWRGEPLAGMTLRAHSDGLSLAFLNALKAPAENIAGQLALDLVLTGSLADPQARGNFELSNGAFAVKRLGLRVNDVKLSASADSRRLTLKQLSARSGSGTISGNGFLLLKRYLPEDMNLTVAARRWPAIANERYQAIVNGDLRAAGAISAPAVSGSVEVIEGTLRPKLAALEKTSVPLERDPTIVVVHERGSAPISTQTKAENANENGLWRALTLDLKINVPKNLWIRHPNANVELSGNLSVAKKSGTEPAITGLIEAVRGWVGFQGRRFEMTRALVRFTGTQPINPSFDVVGEYRAENHQISVIIGGTAEKPTLTLRSDPNLEQSDILAVLLFGKPTAELTGSQQLSLRQNAIDIGAGFAAAQLTKTVADSLGLERLGLDLSELSYSGGQVRVGQYVGQQTFVSFGQEVAGKHSREVSVEYQISRSVRIDATREATGNNGIDIIWHKRY